MKQTSSQFALLREDLFLYFFLPSFYPHFFTLLATCPFLWFCGRSKEKGEKRTGKKCSLGENHRAVEVIPVQSFVEKVRREKSVPFNSTFLFPIDVNWGCSCLRLGRGYSRNPFCFLFSGLLLMQLASWSHSPSYCNWQRNVVCQIKVEAHSNIEKGETTVKGFCIIEKKETIHLVSNHIFSLNRNINSITDAQEDLSLALSSSSSSSLLLLSVTLASFITRLLSCDLT